jgi:aldehyde oxidoreductase
MARLLELVLNGRKRVDAVQDNLLLLDYLREVTGLTGTKIGCDAGDCGACTVLVDGEQACACLVSTAQAEGRAVTTIEATHPLIDRLRSAFLAHGAAQCGICTPGMIMAATDLLSRNASPTKQQIEDGIGGVLCRCTGYVKIIEAVKYAAGLKAEGVAP